MKNFMMLAIFCVTVIILAVIFTADDVTGIGEVLDPLEYIFMGIVGYVAGKSLKW